ncbi:MAG: radical SAM protein [Clostridia bacterium]|nr:radical SAM protein [Clostridia bacterium]
MNLREVVYRLLKMNKVAHTTLNPYGPGVVRLHLVPPKFKLTKTPPSVVIVNGKDILPINMSWAILFYTFIDEINMYEGKEINADEFEAIIHKTTEKVKKVYPRTKIDTLIEDLWKIISTLMDVAYGKEPSENIGYMTLGEYAPHMTAPHRMDLMISAMTREGKWHCNQKCLHCYAAGQTQSEVKELSTSEWKLILDRCRKIGIPQITFTGGEPTMREDLPELIDYAKWFVTRLNTNGVKLTKELCKRLYDASLDSVQITLYSSDEQEHNTLVGANNFQSTVDGIKNAIEAGLNISINTPLCKVNANYLNTLKFLNELGVKYVSCSGLIVTGNACQQESKCTQLTEEELYAILTEAVLYCNQEHIEISFTSPGWISDENLNSLGLTIPTCGACLSNMAIAPNGGVVPCQSWLSEKSLGNILEQSWNSIWNSHRCKEIRKYASSMEHNCPLRKENA